MNMNDNEKRFSPKYDISFIKAFLDGCEKQNRFNISVISSICLELAEYDNDGDKDFQYECAKRIMAQCSQIMKLTDIYSYISDFLSNKEYFCEYTDISTYLSQFASQCSKILGDACSIQYMNGENISSDIVKKILDFILVMYVRKAVLCGAESIKISHSLNDKYITIQLDITDKTNKERFANIAETFSTDFSEQLIIASAEKIKGKYYADKNGMKLTFPMEESGSGKLNSVPNFYGKPLFSTINDILSDLGNISLI